MRLRGLIRIGVPVVLMLLVATGAWIRQRSVENAGEYVGSARCRSCHSAQHTGWADSQHTKMMRAVTGAGVLVADLEAPDTPFDPAEAVWAIGGKWEQQFMGQQDGHETLLPGAWEVAHERWKLTGWDGWQQPVPLERCHGCHTVGLDVETGTFVEPNIGCESCHGPGDWHVATWGLGRIYSTLDADVCGQCHTRGRAPDRVHHFPVAYRPWEPLEEKFTPDVPMLGQNSSYWWGDGRAAKRHQQWIEWRRGGHADSLNSLYVDYDGRYGPVEDACLACHSAEGALGQSVAREDLHPITCGVCHNVHGELDRPRLDCSDCHGDGAYYHAPERNRDHVICGMRSQVQCVDCHMPQMVKIGGKLQFRSHAPGIASPSTGEQWQRPSSCQNSACHPSMEVRELGAAFHSHYGSSDLHALTIRATDGVREVPTSVGAAE